MSQTYLMLLNQFRYDVKGSLQFKMAICRMNETYHHQPVLLKEAVSALVTTPDGLYIDATFGRGGHAKAILEKLTIKGRLIAFDKDDEAVQFAQQYFSSDQRLQIFHQSFKEMEAVISAKGLMGKVNGVLFDLGVSSPQIDAPTRGFSFAKDGPLDMRMDQTKGMTAAEWLQTVSEEKLADILWSLGEEKYSRRIARIIVQQRLIAPIETTRQLADLIKRVVPRSKKEDKHPATRSFQAIRIAINEELTDLALGLQHAFNILAPGGRMTVISFHSLEDRVVKQFIRQLEKGAPLPKGLPIKGPGFTSQLISLGKSVKPSFMEINNNPRARSARLRIAEKQS